MQRIRIQRQAGGVVFNPADQMVDTVTDGGSFIFENNDTQAHHPKPDKGGIWTDNPIAAGQPSTLITAQAPGLYPYTCSLHPTEKGVVTAPNVITIQTQLIQTGFNPASQTLKPSTDNGLFVFLNLDQSVSHRPQPDDAANGTWFTQDIAPGQYSAIKTLTAPGTYNYHCAIHPGETGTIIVKAPAAAT
jgi:plastocyanin